jgi:hypothetical protein
MKPENFMYQQITAYLERTCHRRYWIKSHDSESQGEGPFFAKETAERALEGREDGYYITWTEGE